MTEEKRAPEPVDDPPPIMGTWKKLYLTILLLHAFIIFLFWVFTKYYS